MMPAPAPVDSSILASEPTARSQILPGAFCTTVFGALVSQPGMALLSQEKPLASRPGAPMGMAGLSTSMPVRTNCGSPL